MLNNKRKCVIHEITTDKARGETEDEVKLFPAFPGCMNDANDVQLGGIKRRRVDNNIV